MCKSVAYGYLKIRVVSYIVILKNWYIQKNVKGMHVYEMQDVT